MSIQKKLLSPSREDAVRLTRSEKMSVIAFAYAATILEDLLTEIPDRLSMIDNGFERMKELSQKTDELLNDVRVTIPENQRMNIQNTAADFEMRLMPRATPSQTTVIMQKEEFRELVDSARERCMECTEDDVSCEKCKLYQLLTCLLPMEDYHARMLCPYNIGEWGN